MIALPAHVATTPPSAPLSEREVALGYVTMPEHFATMCQRLSVGDLSDEHHRALATCASQLHPENTPVSVSNLIAKLGDHPVFRRTNIKPADYLGELTLDVIGQLRFVSFESWQYHAGIVADKVRKRRIHALGLDAVSGSLNGHTSDELLANLWAGVEDLRREADPNASEIVSFPLCEFIKQDHRVECLIEGLQPARMGGLIAAKSKGQKTTIACGMDFGLATGTPVLGRFHVPRPVSCGIMSGESGAATIAETFQRIAAASEIDIRDVRNLHVSTEVPQLLTAKDCDSVERFIDRHALESLTIDPSYLAFAGVDDTQLSKMGEVLAPLNGIIQRTVCGIRIVIHNRKTTPAPYGEPTLEEIGGTGLAQWARYWILLNKRREWDPNEGRHWLWFSSGSSAGFGHRYFLDVTEGRRSDPGGRTWQLAFSEPSEGQQREREQEAAEKEAAKLEGERRAVCNALAASPDGLSWSKALRTANVSSRRWDLVNETMLDEGDVEECTITVSNHKTSQPGIKLATSEAT